MGKETRDMTHGTRELTMPKVEERSLVTLGDKGSWWDPDLEYVDGYKALVDADTGRVFNMVTEEYKLVTHEETLGLVDEALANHPELGEYTRTISLPDGGARMRANYVFGDVDYVVDGDILHPELTAFNSYDGGWAHKFKLGAFRVL